MGERHRERKAEEKGRAKGGVKEIGRERLAAEEKEERMRDGERGSFPRYVGASRSDRTHGQFRTALIDFTIERRGREAAMAGALGVSTDPSWREFRVARERHALDALSYFFTNKAGQVKEKGAERNFVGKGREN